MTKPTKEEIIAAIRARGNNATDLRDAAHEAHHALQFDVKPGKWNRETIHRAIVKGGRRAFGEAVFDEIRARAVEQIVCADYGVETGASLEAWAMTSFMEAGKNSGIWTPSDFDWAGKIRERMATPAARADADRVIALASVPFAARKRKAAAT